MNDGKYVAALGNAVLTLRARLPSSLATAPPSRAIVPQTDATHWQVSSADGQTHETIRVVNGMVLHPSDRQLA
jgi:hypothetical protein